MNELKDISLNNEVYTRILCDIDELNEKSQKFYDEVFNFRKDNKDLLEGNDKIIFSNFEIELVNFISFINLFKNKIKNKGEN